MCGRYSLEDKAKIDSKMRGLIDFELMARIKANYNVAPTQKMPVILMRDGKPVTELMHWGIPRVLGKDLVKEIINTRSEKAFERFWGNIVTHQRVLVPATGFYEWKASKDGKQPFYIKPKDRGMFAFAGIWHHWKDKDGTEMDAFSIMTTEPNKEMKGIHNRMPVILHENDYEKWLTSSDKRDDIEPLLRPYEDNGLEMFQVSKAVNVVKNNDNTLILPVNSL